jgi:LysW-gamma-L-lysine carboxypeptidase
MRDAFPDAAFTLAGREPAFRAGRKNALAAAFLRGIRQAGGEPRFLLKTGTSDMNVVGPAWGCPIVAYGPGDSSLDHRPDEHILISEYLRAAEVLTHVLRSLRM